MPCARTRACSLHLHCGLNPTLQIKGLRLREREGPTRDGGGEQPQPRLSGSSPSPTFLCIRLCTALQEQGGLVRAMPEKGQASRCGAGAVAQGERGSQSGSHWGGDPSVCALRLRASLGPGGALGLRWLAWGSRDKRTQMVACAWERWAEHLALALATQSVPSIRILVNTAPPSGAKWKRQHDLVPAGVPLVSVAPGTKKERREGPPPTWPKEQEVTLDI